MSLSHAHVKKQKQWKRSTLTFMKSTKHFPSPCFRTDKNKPFKTHRFCESRFFPHLYLKNEARIKKKKDMIPLGHDLKWRWKRLGFNEGIFWIEQELFWVWKQLFFNFFCEFYIVELCCCRVFSLNCIVCTSFYNVVLRKYYIKIWFFLVNAYNNFSSFGVWQT